MSICHCLLITFIYIILSVPKMTKHKVAFSRFDWFFRPPKLIWWIIMLLPKVNFENTDHVENNFLISL